MSGIPLSGEIKIDPPLNWSEIKQFPSKVKTDRRDVDSDLMLKVDEMSQHNAVAETIIRSADTILPAWTGEAKNYYVEESLQAIADTYPNHSFTGYIEASGSYGGEIVLWRMTITNGKAELHKPTITWPDPVA